MEVSFPQYFFLPSVVQILLKEDARLPWQNLAGTKHTSMNAEFTAYIIQIYTSTYRLHKIKWGNKSSFFFFIQIFPLVVKATFSIEI